MEDFKVVDAGQLVPNDIALPVTNKWLEENLSAGTKAHLKAVEQQKIGVGQGYMAYISRLVLHWEGPGADKLPKTVIFKMPTMERVRKELKNNTEGNPEEDMVDIIGIFHASECIFYNHLRDTDPDLIAMTPRCFYNQPIVDNESGILIFEDLSERGRVVDLMDGLNVQQVKKIVIAMAKMHGWSLSTTHWHEYIKPWDPEMMRNFPNVIRASMEALRKQFPAHYSYDEAKVAPFTDFEKMIRVFDEIHNPANAQKLVMSHGDCWTNNALFAFDYATGEFTDELVAVIDWQNLHPGLCIEDLTRLFISSMQADLRRENEVELLRVYFDALTKKMSPKEVPFSFDEVLRWYKLCLGQGCMMFTFGIPVMLTAAFGRGKAHRIPDVLKRSLAAIDDGYENYRELGLL